MSLTARNVTESFMIFWKVKQKMRLVQQLVQRSNLTLDTCTMLLPNIHFYHQYTRIHKCLSNVHNRVGSLPHIQSSPLQFWPSVVLGVTLDFFTCINTFLVR